MTRRPKITASALLIGTALSLSACSTATLSGRQDLAQDIASSAGLHKQTIAASPFMLAAFIKTGQINAPAHIYIEGDGLAWLSRTQPSLNPTPTDPVALRLAARDKAPNVIYLARPCQYSGTTTGGACQMKYWTGSRYAPEVIAAYNTALNQIKSRYQINDIHLIGFSGGATLAALLAGSRDDVTSLRSVAGNLDHHEHSRVHNVSMLGNSLNPPQYAAKLSGIAQYHFIGGDDKIVPKSIYDSYSVALPAQNCTGYKIIPGVKHDKGWADIWPDLLRIPPRCH